MHFSFFYYFAPLLTDKLSFPSEDVSPHVDVSLGSMVTGSLTETLLGITLRQSRLGVSGWRRDYCCILLLSL